MSMVLLLFIHKLLFINPFGCGFFVLDLCFHVLFAVISSSAIVLLSNRLVKVHD